MDQVCDLAVLAVRNLNLALTTSKSAIMCENAMYSLKFAAGKFRAHDKIGNRRRWLKATQNNTFLRILIVGCFFSFLPVQYRKYLYKIKF